MNTRQICFVSKQVIENNFEITRFFRSKYDDDSISGWFFLFGSEDESFINSPENFKTETLSNVILNKPFIREYIDNPCGSDFFFDKEKERVLDISEKRTLSFNRKIYAPNAGQVRLEPSVWLKYHPAKAINPILALLFLIPAVFHHWAWILISVYFSLIVVVDWIRTFEHFKFGESLPALVVSIKPTLIAVKVEFNDQEQSQHFVKIIKVKLKNLNGKKIEVGDRIGTVNLFSDKIWMQRNYDFQSLPINYGTSNPEKINDVMKRYHRTDWEELKKSIKQLKQPYKQGLYKIGI